jgi:NADH-quinone oxidoreductase subunit M
MSILLTLLIVFPLIAALITATQKRGGAIMFAILGAFATLVGSLIALIGAAGAPTSGFTHEQNYLWLPVLNVHYHVGVDGPAALLVVLTAFLTLAAVIYSGRYVTERTNHYLALLLVLEAATIGAFVSLDLILFYLFFEVCLIPVYFLIGIWGGPRRVAAATKFFVYTVVGSLLMLAAIIGLYVYTGSFDYVAIRSAIAVPGSLAPQAALWMFAGFAIAFAVKTGVFPFHTWLPDAYAEAPTGAVVLLSGALAKLGTYGFYRFCLGLFPEATQRFAPYLVALGVISIIYGALIAAVQRDAKRVIAYSSISHLGFVVVGLFSLTPQGLQGALLQQVNHGITSGALFFIMGMIYERRGTTYIRELGGLWEQMPRFGRLFLIATLSSIALPLTNGFVGEFLILLGAYQRYPVAASFAATGVIWSAIYMLWMFQRVMYGPVANPLNRRLRDVDGTESGLLAVFAVLMFLLGIVPNLATRPMLSAIGQTLRPIENAPAVSELVVAAATPTEAR